LQHGSTSLCQAFSNTVLRLAAGHGTDWLALLHQSALTRDGYAARMLEYIEQQQEANNEGLLALVQY